MKRRFISRGFSWSNGIVTLDREGREFDTETEADLIEMILRSGVNDGGLVIEVPTEQELKNSAVKFVAESLGITIPIPVPTVTAPDIEKELEALEEQEQIKQQQAKEEEEMIAQKRADNLAYREKRTGVKTALPEKGVTATMKAPAAASRASKVVPEKHAPAPSKGSRVSIPEKQAPTAVKTSKKVTKK